MDIASDPPLPVEATTTHLPEVVLVLAIYGAITVLWHCVQFGVRIMEIEALVNRIMRFFKPRTPDVDVEEPEEQFFACDNIRDSHAYERLPVLSAFQGKEPWTLHHCPHCEKAALKAKRA